MCIRDSYGTPPIQLVGQTGGRVKAAAVTSNYAFMVIGARLVVADITNPVEPQVISETLLLSPGSARDIAVQGSLAFVTSTAGLHIVDIIQPTAPRMIGSFPTSAPPYGVAVSGDMALSLIHI